MLKTMVALFLVFIIAIPAFAQEKSIDNITVELGIISWSDLQKNVTEKPRTHTEEYHRRMAKKMAEMHRGGAEGEYHILIVLKDRTTGKPIKDADIKVTAIAKTGLERVTHNLQTMSMDDFTGYGEYFQLSSVKPYVFEVEVYLKEQNKIYKVKFERTLPSE